MDFYTLDLYTLLERLEHLTVTPQMAIVMFAVIVLVIVIIAYLIFFRKKDKQYLRVMGEVYDEKGDVLHALKRTKSAYKKKSKEARAIQDAIDYLDHSILRDYETAFKIIEGVVGSRKVRKLHTTILSQEESKKASQLLLCEKN